MSAYNGPNLETLKRCLLDHSQPIGKRTTAAFYLRTHNSVDAALIISEALLLKNDSSLMRHELAYILGQMQFEESCNILSEILSDENDDCLVRHEAAEALGAIGYINSIEVLTKFSTHSAPEISETCKIAIDLINWKHSEAGKEFEKSRYFLSEDPAPPIDANLPVELLEEKLLNNNLSLFERYRAMFSLRNMNSDASSLALCSGFKDSSALFRHEIAYVLGQMKRKVTVSSLSKVLMDVAEHRMVRHEAAEALGAIGGNDVENLLNLYKDDEEIVVKESCDVALDTIEYWESSGSNFLEAI